MLMIRLARIGKKKQPYDRLVVSEKARDLYGRSLEILGHYNPRTKKIELKKERILHWLKMGARASATVHNLLIANEIIKGEKVKVSEISKKRIEKSKKKSKEDKTKAKEEEPKKESEKTQSTGEQEPKNEPEDERKEEIPKPAEEPKTKEETKEKFPEKEEKIEEKNG